MQLRKSGKESLLCKIRNKIIISTPEEVVRQSFIQELIDDYKIPAAAIALEVPVIDETSFGRADIVIYGFSEKENADMPLVVVECKEPNIDIDLKNVKDQAFGYGNSLKAKFVAITNYNDLAVFHKDETTNEYIEIEQLPLYHDLATAGIKPILIDATDVALPDEAITYNMAIQDMIDRGVIGVDTNPKLHSLLADLWLIFSNPEKACLSLTEATFIDDIGTHYKTFGNATGGSWNCDYRGFLIRGNDGNDIIANVAMAAKASLSNDPLYGNSKGHTMLIVGIEASKTSHSSLQLNLDKFAFTETNADAFTDIIWHDGTLTVGKLGRMQNSIVVSAVQQKRPDLVKNGKIELGRMRNTDELNWGNAAVNSFVSNLVDYALIRDEIRAEFKSTKSSLR